MERIPEDWEVVSRKTNHWWIGAFFILSLAGPHSSVTWTIRQKSTGVTKRVTARSESEVADIIANGWFDADKAVAEE
jgi:hypothetical protein